MSTHIETYEDLNYCGNNQQKELNVDTEVSDLLNLTNLKKKKKKSVIEETIKENKDDEEYSYTDLLTRLYKFVRDADPTYQDIKKQKIPPPSVSRLGTKKTVLSNFTEISKVLQRSTDHIKSFFETELSCQCSINSEGKLILVGKFLVKHFEEIIRKYVMEFVCCKNCKSINTCLIKNPVTRLLFIDCNKCKSTRTITTKSLLPL